jgi:xanthine dehydrogenase YagS FAD-binding subunit
MEAFAYANPATLQEATAILASSLYDAQVLAGGTDLISLMKDYILSPATVVNIKNIKELGGLTAGANGLRIGATATFDDLASNAAVRTGYPAIHAAVLGITSPQIRNMGTVGGDLCQWPRCWYFRNGYGLLAMQDGKSLVAAGENKYHAIFGGPAHFVSASSLGPALIALGARVTLESAQGSRTVEVAKFFVTPTDKAPREIDLRPGEILTEIVVPPAAGVKNATYELREREAIDWPLATASVALKMAGGKVSSAKVVMGHVGPTPIDSAAAAQAVTGRAIDEVTAEAAGAAAVEGAKPLSGNAYKVQLAKVAVKRALLAAGKA